MVPGKKYTPEDYLLIAWRRKWLIVLPFLLLAAGTAVYSRSLPSFYRSETLILVVPQRVPQSFVASTVTTQIDQRLHAISQQVLSRSRMERMIVDLDLYPERRQTQLMDEIVQRMVADIKVDIQRTAQNSQSGTSLGLSYVSTNPLKAMQVVERLATMFTDANLKDRELLADGTDQFIEAELVATRNRMEEMERALEDFRQKHPFEQPEELENNRWGYVNAQQHLMNHQAAQQQARERLLFLERMLADLAEDAAAAQVSSPGPGEAPVGGAAAQLEEATRRLRSLELRLKPEHPDMIAEKRVIAELERKAHQEALAAPLSAEPVSGVAIAAVTPQQREKLRNIRDEVDKLQRSLATGDAEEARLRGIVEDWEKRIGNVPTRVRQVADLTRDLYPLRTQYFELMRKKESARIAANLERQQIGEQMRIVEPARVPSRPFSPDRQRLNMLGAALGFALGLALTAFFEYRDTSLRTDEDVIAALALPVLALVPVMRTVSDVQRARRRRVIWSMTGLVALVISGAVLAMWSLRTL